VNWRDGAADWHFALMPVRTGRKTTDWHERRMDMPLVDIELIEGAFDEDQKQRMIRDVTEAMVGIEGEAMRGVTWVRVQEIASGEWAIGGKSMTAKDVMPAQSEPA
jgi:4-oxalocrotonate tautomerase